MNKFSDEEFCKKLPKIDLHCHLSGCFRPSTLDRLLKEKNLPRINYVCGPLLTTPQTNQEWSVANEVFFAIGKAIGNLEELAHNIHEAVEDLAKAGLIYVELRIGLKELPTMQAYLDHLIKVTQDAAKKHDIVVKLLLTLARHQAIGIAEKIAEIAIEYWLRDGPEGVVVGIDFAGNPYEKHFSQFAPLLHKLRTQGLKITLHCGERLDNQDEWREMVAWKPDRLGHCIHLSKEVVEMLNTSKIPVEACLSVSCRWYVTPHEHHPLFQLPDCPLILCVDNTTLNETDLSKEYLLALSKYGFSREQLVQLSRRSLEVAFCSASQKKLLLEVFDKRIKDMN